MTTAQVRGTNVALNRPTWQSSTGYGGVSDRAVDGNKETYFLGNSCTHTARGTTELPVWGVDLGMEQDVAFVEVTNRKDDGECLTSQ